MKGRLIIQREKGVTLIALVVTITVLLILASVTITSVFGDNGILIKAQEAANKTQEAIEQEQAELNQMYNELASAMNNTSEGDTDPDVPVEPELPSDGSYSEAKGVNTPSLGEGMTPIKWNGSTWVKTTEDDEEWYDYSAKKWANATTSDGSMWVWIPRYAYSITSGYHTNTAGTIEVEFMKGTSNEGATGKKLVEYNSTTTNNYANFPNGYVVHPAFVGDANVGGGYGNNNGESDNGISGIWVAKFEASNSSGEIKIEPGVQSWRNISINDIYTNCLNYNSTLNSHMMKNSEWGAVAYLSKSVYGKNGEVTINSNSSNYTGGGSGNSYVNNGVQSTTGNVYGIYDMSGGAFEYVAAYVNNGDSALTSYGSSLANGDAKTKNVYAKGDDTRLGNYNANTSKYGDAIYETSSRTYNGIVNSGNSSWYSDYSYYPFSNNPFFARGGHYNMESGAGTFCFYNLGFTDGAYSFRPVLIVV